MNFSVPIPEALPSGNNDPSFDQFAQLFVTREDCLILMAQLNQLTKAVQRHRGTSMGLIAGNSVFKAEFEQLQRQLERRLATLEAFARGNKLLSDRDKENLSLAWATIRSNWEGDDLKDNFELHSHFVEQLLAMNFSLSKQLEVPLIMPHQEANDGVEAFSKKRMFQQVEIIQFVAKALPEIIEQIAKIRGMATYAAAAKSLLDIDERKLRFLLANAEEQNQKLQAQAEKLDETLEGRLQELDAIKKLELQLLQFLNIVEGSVFSGKGSRDDAEEIFNLATDIIDIYWGVVNEGLALIRTWHSEDLEAWIKL
jgi:regulator of replication initiation timing